MMRSISHFKKKWFCMVLVFVCILAGCQPTPQTPIVAHRGEGLLEDYVIPPLPDGQFRDVDAPAHWQGRYERGAGAVAVEADVVLDIPPISNIPILELEQVLLEEERLEELIHYFLPDAALYGRPAMTRAELQHQLEMMKAKRGLLYGMPFDSWGDEQTRLEELIVSAPELAEENPIEIGFCEPMFREYDAVMYGEQTREDEPCYFEALADVGSGPPAMILAQQYSERLGISSGFSYSVGRTMQTGPDSFDENLVRQYREKIGTATGWGINEAWLTEYEQYVRQRNEIVDSNKMTQRDAQVIADRLLAELGVDYMALAKAGGGLWVAAGYAQWDYLGNADYLKDSQPGYFFEYYRKAGSLFAYQQMASRPYGTLPELSYSPPFRQETITVFVAEDGVKQFSWDNMARQVGVVADNVKLLPFDEIAERLADHMLYIAVAAELSPPIEYHVVRVELRMAYATAFEHVEYAWLMPVWVFEQDIYMRETEDGPLILLGGNEPVQINAIDGGFVSAVV